MKVHPMSHEIFKAEGVVSSSRLTTCAEATEKHLVAPNPASYGVRVRPDAEWCLHRDLRTGRLPDSYAVGFLNPDAHGVLWCPGAFT